MCHLQLVTMLMRWSTMCCHWRYVDCYLGVHGSMIAMLYMRAVQIHILLCMMGKHQTLKPMGDDLIKSDVVLVVRKEKLHKAKPQSSLAKLQPEEHDAKSVSTETDSTMPVDDKPVVLVSDKPAEIKPLISDRRKLQHVIH